MEQKSTPLRLSGSQTRPVVRDIAESLGKLPPQAIDVEEAVLGALLSEKNALIEIAGVLKPDHFYSEQHQTIYQAILDLFAAGSPIDLRTVVSQLRKAGKLEIVGGAYYLSELTGKISSSANIEYHSRILIEIAIKRSLITIASMMHQDAYEDTTDVFELYARVNMELQDVLDRSVNNRAEKPIKEIAYRLTLEVQNRQKGVHGGLDTGFPLLDRAIGGLQKTNLIIIAARPAMGKTALVMQIGKQVAEQKIPVGIFSLEMGNNELVERLSVAESEVFADKVKKGDMDGHDFQRWLDAVGLISSLPIFIDDTPSLTIVELRARCIRMKIKYGVQLIIIDYLQLIRGINKMMNRDQEIGLITRTLKGIAKELDIPVIALSQLSRDVEKRGGSKRPVLSDLRESGSIEQDADVVAFIYRPEYYHITQDEEGYSTHGLAEIIIAKHRHGGLDTVKQKFIGKFTKFAEWISEYQPKDQSTYIAQHVKQVLPSERTPEQLDDTPF